MPTIDDVLFRKYPNGDIIAIFPNIQWDDRPTREICTSYMQCGQHSPCDPARVVKATTLATPEEYADLHYELIEIGYEPSIVTRRNHICLKK